MSRISVAFMSLILASWQGLVSSKDCGAIPSASTACWKSAPVGRGVGQAVAHPSCTDANSCCMTGTCKSCRPAGTYQASETGSCKIPTKGGQDCQQTSCASGYTSTAETCYKSFPPHSYAKFSCTNPEGCYAPTHPVEDAGLCYASCPTGKTGIGPVCWGECGGEYPVDGGAMCCKTTADCSKQIIGDVKHWLTASTFCGTVEDDGDIVTCVQKTAKATCGMVLPVCGGGGGGAGAGAGDGDGNGNGSGSGNMNNTATSHSDAGKTAGIAIGVLLGVSVVGLAVYKRDDLRRRMRAGAATRGTELKLNDVSSTGTYVPPEDGDEQQDNPLNPLAPRSLANTEVSMLERQQDGGSNLVGKRIEVVGKGRGIVVRVIKARGKATKHAVSFDDGSREELLLSKNGDGKGHKFYLEAPHDGQRPEDLANTMISVAERQKDGGSSLTGKRIEVVGKGRGTVVDIVKTKGKSTRHVVLFDSGSREELQLSKVPDGTGGTAHKFYVELSE